MGHSALERILQDGSRAKEVSEPRSIIREKGGATFASARSSFSHLSAVVMDTVVDRGESCGSLDLLAIVPGVWSISGTCGARLVHAQSPQTVLLSSPSVSRRRL